MVVKKVECEGYGGLGSNGSRKTEVVVQSGVSPCRQIVSIEFNTKHFVTSQKS